MFSFKKKFSQTRKTDEIWFIKDFSSEKFVKTNFNPLEKKLLLIKQLSNNTEACYCPVHKKWEHIKTISTTCITTQTCSLEGIIQNFTLSLFQNKQEHTSYNYFFPSELFNSIKNKVISINQLESNQLTDYLGEYCNYKKSQIKNNHTNDEKFTEENSKPVIHSDILFYNISVNNFAHTLTLSQFAINRAGLKHEYPFVYDDPSIPLLLTFSEVYDIQNGIYSIQKNEGAKLPFSSEFVQNFYYPKEIYECCEKLIKEQINIVLNKNITFVEYTALNTYSNYEMHSLSRNSTSILNDKLKALIYFPYEPALYFSIKGKPKSNLDEIIKNNSYRLDSNCYSNYCSELKINSCKTIRKIFYKNPVSLHTYKLLCDMGFNDINIIKDILYISDIDRFIYDIRNYLKFYFEWAIPLKGQRGAWNLVEKSFKQKKNFLTDTLRMLQTYFQEIPFEIRKSILSDGFTQYNHDLLSKFTRELQQKNVDFNYSKEEYSLEDKINGYEFLLPKDYYTLKEVATCLHNCAASYRNRILAKKTVVMYARKNNNYVLCIEVCNNEIYQQYTDRNMNPVGEDLTVLKLWQEKHNLTLKQRQVVF